MDPNQIVPIESVVAVMTGLPTARPRRDIADWLNEFFCKSK
jgi:hypothetical protein